MGIDLDDFIRTTKSVRLDVDIDESGELVVIRWRRNKEPCALSFSPEQARELAAMLLDHAKRAE